MRSSLRFFKWFFWTVVVSVILCSLLYMLINYLYYNYGNWNIIRIVKFFYYNIGNPEIYYVAAIPVIVLTGVYVYRRESRKQEQNYLALLIEEVHNLEEGQLDRKVTVRSVGKLGQLAADINRMMERLRISLEEERRAEQTKNELITNVSHDLRTPLTTITGYLGLIDQDRYRDEVELRYYNNMAYEESLRLKQLLEDLFEYTRLRNREMTLNKSRINLVEMLHQITAQFQWQLGESGMESRLFFEQNQMIVIADGDKLRRVYENLISNAIRYGNEGRYLDIRGRIEGQEAVIDVINYGEPIPDSDIPRLFERFYRVEKSRDKNTGGSGIGLAIAKHIVDLHQGSIRAASDEERTVFTVRIAQNV
ncbi:HAMP domain-containing sensor histidine kinase [Paenibacillus sp. YPG26]|uniref:sensor histidine kinase n=1 Tax=Paenibacillus sp. YPG26 TaxID=2878915 RepID=UPI00203CB5C5|nr:HAMP domain-containing sensor histidine kinase [Paenibacillus sp. YPG26]USB31952.1 two-component sensor histidine kinase [Paenibacillus sp. YPG26]